MKLFEIEHTACYICGQTGEKADVMMLDWEAGNDGSGFGPVRSPLLQIALCKDCRKKLLAVLEQEKCSNANQV